VVEDGDMPGVALATRDARACGTYDAAGVEVIVVT
jgi:hypothetical protein